MQSTKSNPRAVAFELLLKSERSGQFSNIVLDQALDSSELSEADKRLASLLFYGVTEKKITLDHRISELSARPLSDIEPTVLCLARMGLYQLMFTERIPPHAAINETVSLCPRRASGFVNALLRSHLRSGEMRLPSMADEPQKYLSVKYSVCEPLAKRFIDIFGGKRAESILASLDNPPPTTLRVNTLKASRQELTEHIEGAEPTEISPHGLRFRGAVRSLYGYGDGLFFVQDEASQICVEALDAHEGMRVLDICACPGSKSFGGAINMKNKGEVLSFDLHKNKLSLIESGALRLGIDIISTAEQDGRMPIDRLLGSADRVLCDVPCSGFGVLAKKPELRYKNPALSDALPQIQAQILDNACRYVKIGGVLVYSTCTVFPEENEKNIEGFLAKHPEFSLTPFSVGDLDVKNGYITLLPDEYPTDGFFIAKLTRN